MKTYHLVGKGFSGRAVKLRDLEPRQKDAALITAAKSFPPGAEPTRLELNLAASREAVKMMIAEVTAEKSQKDNFRVDPATKWTKVTRAELDQDGGPYSYDRLFTSKDDGFLTAIYNRDNEPSAKEIEAIAAGEIPLADE